MGSTTHSGNPFSLSLGPIIKGTDGVASVWLDFHPNCSNCGMRLRAKDRIASAEMPLIRSGNHKSVPNYLCPSCQIPTQYTNDMMVECVHQFHLKYPSSVLLERGIKGLTFVNRVGQDEDLT